jgi:hypothetical protein
MRFEEGAESYLSHGKGPYWLMISLHEDRRAVYDWALFLGIE